MRIISGFLKGRVIDSFDIKGTRPTMNRVRESVFSSISSYIPDSVVLDLFCGSGILGAECISNYASYVYFNDNNSLVIKTLKGYLDKFNVTNYSLFNLDYMDMLNKMVLEGKKFDIIFLDPPYKYNVLNDVVEFILTNNILNSGGIIVIEHSNNYNLNDYDNISIIKNKRYGDKFVTILRLDI